MRIAVALYREGQITAEQLAEALCVQASRKKPIGQIALERRLLSMKDAMRILAQQADAPNLQFGEIACSLGLLSTEDVTVLLGEQERSLPTLSSVLLQLGYVDEHQVAEQVQNLVTCSSSVQETAACYTSVCLR